MPALKKFLHAYDHDLLERIASFWGVDAGSLDAAAAVDALAQAMQNAALAVEVIDSLPQPAKDALEFLTDNSGKVPWPQFSRKFGEVREFGPARREREEPEKHPTSTAEILWYRGLIGKAFMDLPPEPREFAFLPDELMVVVQTKEGRGDPFVLEKVAEDVVKRVYKADGRLLDHMTDWLACKRMNRQVPGDTWKAWHVTESFLSGLAIESGLVDKMGMPLPEALANFFQLSRGEALLGWASIWMKSVRIDDLRAIPDLACEGDWRSDPTRPRAFLMERLHRLKPGAWYSLSSLVEAVKAHQPDFQRPSGDYDSWFIRKAGGGEYLRGFQHWDDVDGALLRYLVRGPLHSLGLIDLGSSNEQSVSLFRLSGLWNAFIDGGKPPVGDPKEVPLKITPDLKFSIPVFSSRTLRYQVARFCELSAVTSLETKYEITAGSLTLAENAGLKPAQLVQLLEKQLKSPLPKSLTLLAENWEKHGAAVKIASHVLLRACSPEVMRILQNDPQTAKVIVELLTPTAAIVNRGGIRTIQKVLIENGLLTEVELEV